MEWSGMESEGREGQGEREGWVTYLVDDIDASVFEHLDDGPSGRTSGCFAYLDLFLDDDLGVLCVRRRSDGGQEGEIDGEGFAGQSSRCSDGVAQLLGTSSRKSC